MKPNFAPSTSIRDLFESFSELGKAVRDRETLKDCGGYALERAGRGLDMTSMTVNGSPTNRKSLCIASGLIKEHPTEILATIDIGVSAILYTIWGLL